MEDSLKWVLCGSIADRDSLVIARNRIARYTTQEPRAWLAGLVCLESRQLSTVPWLFGVDESLQNTVKFKDVWSETGCDIPWWSPLTKPTENATSSLHFRSTSTIFAVTRTPAFNILQLEIFRHFPAHVAGFKVLSAPCVARRHRSLRCRCSGWYSKRMLRFYLF